MFNIIESLIFDNKMTVQLDEDVDIFVSLIKIDKIVLLITYMYQYILLYFDIFTFLQNYSGFDIYIYL